MSPDPAKIAAVKFPIPENKRDVRSFLGLAGYYRKLIKNYAALAVALTRKNTPSKVVWTGECDRAFESVKEALCKAPVLKSPNFSDSFVLQTDASDRGVGAVLSQLDADGEEHPVSYYSRKLLPREVRYSTVEKECLAIKLSLEAFKVYLLGRRFKIVTDHRALQWINSLKDKNARLLR